jgi:hypothetical protein
VTDDVKVIELAECKQCYRCVHMAKVEIGPTRDEEVEFGTPICRITNTMVIMHKSNCPDFKSKD